MRLANVWGAIADQCATQRTAEEVCAGLGASGVAIKAVTAKRYLRLMANVGALRKTRMHGADGRQVASVWYATHPDRAAVMIAALGLEGARAAAQAWGRSIPGLAAHAGSSTPTEPAEPAEQRPALVLASSSATDARSVVRPTADHEEAPAVPDALFVGVFTPYGLVVPYDQMARFVALSRLMGEAI